MKTSKETHLFEAEFIESLNHELRSKSAIERIRHTWQVSSGKAIFTTSFGINSALMLYLASKAVPQIPVVWIDTGYHFQETYEFAEQLKELLNLNLKVYNPAITNKRAEILYGKLWEQGNQGLKRYEYIHKIEPMNRALRDLDAKAWITGLYQKSSSKHTEIHIASWQDNIVKVHPIAEWTDNDVAQYLKEKGLPYHPLREKGYSYIGDWHSTKPPIRKETNTGKHEINYVIDYQI